jgi:hypothetical protein
MEVPNIGDVLWPNELQLRVTEITDNIVYGENERANSCEIPTVIFEYVDVPIQKS